MNKMKIITSILMLCLVLSVARSQEFPFGTDRWEINAQGSSVEMYEGKPSLYIYRGRATLKDFEFFTGILEYDVFVTKRRGFPGIHFRVQDQQNFEEFYVRPHQSGNDDANQYTPVFNGVGAWQLYYGERFSSPHAYNFNEWNHIKLVVAERRMEVYINDMETPSVIVPELKREPKAGGLGFQGGGPSGFHLANLKVTKMANPPLKGTPAAQPELPAGLVNTWSVSGPFAEASLDNVYTLSKDQKTGLTWANLNAEERGYVNLSRVARRTPATNTVFVKVTINSDKKQVKKLSYGLSDRGKIYLNDQILAGGQNNYASQDYRHLGTIGFFDDVYLPLKKGDNELWIAVSENFGGWGVMAALENLDGVTVK